MSHRSILHVLLCLVAAFVAAPYSQRSLAAIDQPIYLDLPPQSLTQSIIDLGKTSKISIVVPSNLTRDIASAAIKGSYTPEEALNTLLTDTALTFRVINNRVIAIIPKKTEATEVHFSNLIDEELVIIGRKVTGSRLDRIDLQGSSPIDIITRHEIDVSGSQNVAEFLKSIPAVSGNSTSTAVSNGGDGTATVTLRGLPANNTLVLINGRRINLEGFSGDSVNLNSIPSAVVDRIEILKDGASAIYGTDAIAGVINIILQKEYEGMQFEQYLGTSYKSDIETSSTHFLWGVSGDRGSLLLSAQHFDQEGLFSRERAISSDADGRDRGGADKRSTATPNSRITLSDGSVVTLNNNAAGTSIDDYRLATDEDRFNFLSQTSTISPSDRQSLFASGHLALSDSLTLSAETSFTKTQATITLASTPLFTAFENTPIAVAADNIYNPFGQEISDVRRRVVELPPREQENTTEATRVGVTLDGYWDDGSWELNGSWNSTEVSESITNLLSEARVLRALGPSSECQGADIDGCEPLDLFGPAGSITQEQLAYVRSSSLIEGRTQLYGLGGNLSTRIFELPAGSVYTALGVDLRRESIDSKPVGEDSFSTNIGGVSEGATVGSRRIYEAFFEAQLPIAKRTKGIYSLDLELAVRHSYYTDFGNNTSPKLGLRFRPLAQVLLRSTYSEGFRAPSLGELFTGSFQSQIPLTDPCSFAENVGVLPGCLLQSDDTRTQYLVTFAGEPDLRPETSRSYTFGLVWTPRFAENLHISLDHFNINQENVVTANAQLILDRNAWFNEFSDFVTRDENGEIIRLFAPFINIGERKVSGFDITLRHASQLAKRGTLSYSLNASYLDEYAFKLDSDSAFENLEGTFEDQADEGSGALPKWKANTGIFWSHKRFEFNYSVNYISSLTETIPFTEDETRKIESWFTHDTRIAYRFGKKKNLQMSLGIDNIWNEEPPFAASAFNDNYDARTYDIKGQFWYGRLLYSF